MTENEHLKNKICELKNELEVYKKALVIIGNEYGRIVDGPDMCRFCIDFSLKCKNASLTTCSESIQKEIYDKAKESLNDKR
jgi:hypothetical protein